MTSPDEFIAYIVIQLVVRAAVHFGNEWVARKSECFTTGSTNEIVDRIFPPHILF